MMDNHEKSPEEFPEGLPEEFPEEIPEEPCKIAGEEPAETQMSFHLSLRHAATIFIVWLLSQLIGTIVLSVSFGVLGGDLTDNLALIGAVSVYISALCVGYWVYRDISVNNAAYRAGVGFQAGETSPGNSLLLIVIAFILIRAFSSLYTIIVPESVDLVQNSAGEEIITAVKDTAFSFSTLITYFALIILAPIMEEIIFRGYLQTAVEKHYGSLVAVAVSSVVFAAVHFNFAIFPLYLILGAGFGLLFLRTRSLWPAILLHMLNNAVAVVYQVFFV